MPPPLASDGGSVAAARRLSSKRPTSSSDSRRCGWPCRKLGCGRERLQTRTTRHLRPRSPHRTRTAGHAEANGQVRRLLDHPQRTRPGGTRARQRERRRRLRSHSWTIDAATIRHPASAEGPHATPSRRRFRVGSRRHELVAAAPFRTAQAGRTGAAGTQVDRRGHNQWMSNGSRPRSRGVSSAAATATTAAEVAALSGWFSYAQPVCGYTVFHLFALYLSPPTQSSHFLSYKHKPAQQRRKCLPRTPA